MKNKQIVKKVQKKIFSPLSNFLWTLGIIIAAYISLSPQVYKNKAQRGIASLAPLSFSGSQNYLGIQFLDPLNVIGGFSNPVLKQLIYSNAGNDILSPYNPYLLYSRAAQLRREVNLMPALNWESTIAIGSTVRESNPEVLNQSLDVFQENLMKIMDAASFESQARRQTFGLLERERSPMNSVIVNLNASQPASFAANPKAIAWGDELKFKGKPLVTVNNGTQPAARIPSNTLAPAKIYIVPVEQQKPASLSIGI